MPSNIKFQFHKGTIKTVYRCVNILADSDFNSIKVQLKLIDLSRLTKDNVDFNSIKVQLKLRRGICCLARSLISIP